MENDELCSENKMIITGWNNSNFDNRYFLHALAELFGDNFSIIGDHLQQKVMAAGNFTFVDSCLIVPGKLSEVAKHLKTKHQKDDLGI